VKHVLGSPAATEAAITYFREKRPLLLFVHLDDVDHAGHSKTWEGPEYKAAVETIDGLIGKMVAAVPEDKTLVVIVSDHGGNKTGHGNDTTNELQIPLIFAGPGTKKGELAMPARNLDMAPTVIKALGLKPHACWEGKALPAVR
jgi:phosphopentomutase